MSSRSRSTSLIGSVCSSIPKEKSVETTSEKLELPCPRITTEEDVIRNFFNQIVEFAIEDMFVIELEEKKSVEEAPNQSTTIIKDFKELDKNDLRTSEVTAVEGSKLSLKKSTSSRLSNKKMKSTSSSKLSIIKEGSLDKVRASTSNSKLSITPDDYLEKKSSTTSTSLLSDSFFDEERSVKITFTNGNTYEGQISKRIMNGKGVYRWSDGTIYEGDFLDGFPTGQGEMILPDLSRYVGSFNQGVFNGEGFLNVVATPTFYSGHWKDGKKHGKGWLLYEPGDWYDGEWSNDLKDGFGVRYYKNGAKYRGTWRNGVYEGEGIMIWENNDYYKGEWSEGLMHGQGEYIWKAFFNKSFTFPVQNIYKGSWAQGKRCGRGEMHFGGYCGTRLRGTWEQNFKHGDGYLICGNGTVVDRANFFHYDKPLLVPSSTSLSETCPYTILEVPVFTVPEEVDVGYYINKILEKLKGEDPEKLQSLKAFEAKCIQHTIIQFLPQLNDLYKNYATTCARSEELHHQPLLVRIFLWHFYREVEIHKYGISLVEADQILADNPKSALDSLHDPFEPIYFWQFLMSLIGVALMTCSLEEKLDVPATEGVCSCIIKRFFQETVFKKPSNDKSCLVFTYVDLVPIKSVYALYLKLGEPHTAKTFLRNCCIRKSDIPLLCDMELFHESSDPKIGKNAVILAENVTFMKNIQNTEPTLNEDIRHNWTSLFNLRHLGPKNIVRCLNKVCPTIIQDDVIANIDYPLTFLEFYETLLTCIFMVLDLELQKEKKIIEQNISTPSYDARGQKPGSAKGRLSLKSGDSRKKITKGEKKSGRAKKK